MSKTSLSTVLRHSNLQKYFLLECMKRYGCLLKGNDYRLILCEHYGETRVFMNIVNSIVNTHTCLMNSPLSLWYVDEILLKKLHVVMKWKNTLCVHFLNDQWKNETKSSKLFTHHKIFSFFIPFLLSYFAWQCIISSEYKKCNKNNFELHFIFQDYYYYSLFSRTKKFLGKPIIRQYNRLYHSTIQYSLHLDLSCFNHRIIRLFDGDFAAIIKLTFNYQSVCYNYIISINYTGCLKSEYLFRTNFVCPKLVREHLVHWMHRTYQKKTFKKL